VDKALSFLARRRAALAIGTGLAGAALALGVAVLRAALRPTAILTGLLLYGLVVALALFNGRKKLPFIPLARASTWLQVHIYVGWLCVLVFFLHAGFRWPLGLLEQLVAAAFLIVALSGVFGMLLSRWLPGRLNRSGEALTYERIPEIRQEIRSRDEALIAVADRESESSTMGDFYLNHLLGYINMRPGLLSPIVGQPRMYWRTVGTLASLERYFNAREREVAAELTEWIEAKRNLDTQFAGQRLLKLWLFVHIPMTAALLLLGLAHGLIALRYAGGL
jgi:hypothetical protein